MTTEGRELETPTEPKPDVKATLTEKVIGNFTKAEISTLQSTIAAGTTKEQFNLFLQTCVNSGLNPFLNHIHAVTYVSQQYGPQLSIQVAVEGIAYLARKHPDFIGYDQQTVCEKDSFKVKKVDGRLEVVEHEFQFPRGKIIGAYAVAYKKGAPDFLSIMERTEWEHLKEGKNGKNWKKYEADFAKKTVLKRALKAQFGVEINEDSQTTSASEEEEFPEYKPDVRREVSEEPPLITTDEEEKPKTELELMQEQWNLIDSLVSQYGLSKDVVKKIITNKIKKNISELTLQNLAAIAKYVELEGQNKKSDIIDAEPAPEPPKTETKKPSVYDEMDEMENLFDVK